MNITYILSEGVLVIALIISLFLTNRISRIARHSTLHWLESADNWEQDLDDIYNAIGTVDNETLKNLITTKIYKMKNAPCPVNNAPTV